MATSNATGPIRATLTGSDTASAAGLTVRAYAPVLSICGKLIAAGHDPDSSLHCYRGDTLALIVRSIGEAARLEVNSHGTAFIALRPRRAASSVAQRDRKAIPIAGTKTKASNAGGIAGP